MTAVAIDPDELRSAIPQVEHLISLLEDNARALAGITLPAGVPAGLAARVSHTVDAAGRGLQSRAGALHPVPEDLQRRLVAAGFANAPWMTATGWTLPLLGLYDRSFSIQTLSKSMTWGMAARDVRNGLAGGETYEGGAWRAFRMSSAAAKDAGITRGVPPGLAKAASLGGRGLTAVSWSLAAYSQFRNPNLSTEQKIGRTGAHIATGMGVSVLSGAAAGAAFGSAAGPVGTLVGFGAGTAWTILDNKFKVSDKIGDAAADAADTVGDAAGDAAHGVKSVAGKALGAIGL